VIAQFPFLQAITERDRRWPRIVAMALAAPIVFIILSIVIAVTMALSADGDIFAVTADPALQRSAIYVLQLGAGLGGLAFGIMLAARYVFSRPLSTWLTAAPLFRWNLVLWGAALTIIGVAVVMTVDVVILGDDFDYPVFDPSYGVGLKLAYVVAVLIGLFVAATAEEVVFRGYLLQQTAALTKRTWLVIAINAAVFALFHLEFDPTALAARALAGAAFAWAALRLGGLEFAIGAHVATNLMLALIQGPMLPEDPGVAGDVDDVLGEVGLALYMVWAVEITRRMPRLMGSISSPA
jgi:membrane protease YdiL (CAAX protease family)